MKYKKLSKEQILISLDRLTRFKKTKDKYLRVFYDIIQTNLIEPKIKKSELKQMDYRLIAEYVSCIFNSSLDHQSEDRKINKLLIQYENTLFSNTQEVQLLLDNDIDYVSALSYIDDSSPINLRWLKSLLLVDSNEELIKNRNANSLKYPIEKVILVEGITEEILLPVFSKYLGHDFYKEGLQIIAAGGKNQVVKMYYELSQELKIPIFILLDKDAEENIEQIKPRLRDIDKIHLVSCGEFEDLLPKSLIVKTVNSHFKNFLTITESDFIAGIPTAKILEEIFKTKGLHEFKKAEFAKLVKCNITHSSDISPEIAEIIEEMIIKNKSLDTKFCS